MLETLRTGDKEFRFDPETSFWGIGDPLDLEGLYRQVEENLRAETAEFRFKTEILLLYVNPVDGCNAHCVYCYLPERVKARNHRMSLSDLRTVTEKAVAYWDRQGVKGSVIFHGTEPLLGKENIFRVIREFGQDLHFGIQTNGTLLCEEDVEIIRNHDVHLGVSLDSPFEQTNDSLRGAGHYQKVTQVLDWFRGYGGLAVVTTITCRNVHQLSEMVRFLHEKEVSLCLMNPVRATQPQALAFRPDPLGLASRFIEAVEESIRLTKEGRRIVIADFANVLLGVIAPSARVMMCDISPCGGGRRFLSVCADGNAYPCGEFIGMEEFVGGNLLTDPLGKVVESKNFSRVRERTVERVPTCRACLVRNLCGAPCPAEIYAREGTLFGQSYYCEFHQAVARHAFEVIYRDDVRHVIRESALQELYRLRKPSLQGDNGCLRRNSIRTTRWS